MVLGMYILRMEISNAVGTNGKPAELYHIYRRGWLNSTTAHMSKCLEFCGIESGQYRAQCVECQGHHLDN